MRKWYFENIPDLKASLGFKTRFSLTNEGRSITHKWSVIEVIENKSIRYQWIFDKYPGKSYSDVQVTQLTEDTSKLTLTCIVKADFPNDIPEFKRES